MILLPVRPPPCPHGDIRSAQVPKHREAKVLEVPGVLRRLSFPIDFLEAGRETLLERSLPHCQVGAVFYLPPFLRSSSSTRSSSRDSKKSRRPRRTGCIYPCFTRQRSVQWLLRRMSADRSIECRVPEPSP